MAKIVNKGRSYAYKIFKLIHDLRLSKLNEYRFITRCLSAIGGTL